MDGWMIDSKGLKEGTLMEVATGMCFFDLQIVCANHFTHLQCATCLLAVIMQMTFPSFSLSLRMCNLPSNERQVGFEQRKH